MKKGRHSVGVGRQYSGTAGRTLNSQIGVFACYASRFGHALIDRQLYLPKDWASDEARRKRAYVPGDVTFATKPAMARDIEVPLAKPCQGGANGMGLPTGTRHRQDTERVGCGSRLVLAKLTKRHHHQVERLDIALECLLHQALQHRFSIMLWAEPGDMDRIREAARTPQEQKAWLEGSWDIVAGGMVDDLWDERMHVVDPLPIPRTLTRAFDWGSSKPFSVGWYAEADGSTVETNQRPRSTVRGDLFRIDEWCGCSKQANTGVRMLARDIAAGINRREINWGIHGRVEPGPADASIFDVENGMSSADDKVAEIRIDGELYSGIDWAPADKAPGSRRQGWEQLRQCLSTWP